MAVLGWIQSGDRMTGQGGAYPDTLNRALRQLLTESGYNPDAEFPGLPGPVYNIKVAGAVGDGVVNDAAAIATTFSTASARATVLGINTTVLVPAGFTFLVNTALALPHNVNLQLEGTIKAGAAMAAVIQTPLATLANDLRIFGYGVIDCNELATIGIDLRYFADASIFGVVIRRPGLKGIHLGDTTAPGTSFGAAILNVKIDRKVGDANIPAGSIGVHGDYASDNRLVSVVVIGSQTGIRHDLGNNRATNVHCWAHYQNGAMTTGFDDNGNSNSWTECYADTPSLYGFRVRQFSTRIIGGAVYVGQFGGVDNVVTGVWHDQATAFNTIIGLHFYGSSGVLRIKKDIDGSGSLSSVYLWGCQYTNVVTQTTQQMGSMKMGNISMGTFSAFGRCKVTQSGVNGGLALDGISTDSARVIEVQTGGVRRNVFGGDGATETGTGDGTNPRITIYDDAGTSIGDVFWADRKTKEVKLTLGQLKIAGQWNNPLILDGALRVWRHTTGSLYIKDTAPTAIGDGLLIPTQAAALVSAIPADNLIGTLAISAAYSQAEVTALRNQCEALRDALADLYAKLQGSKVIL